MPSGPNKWPNRKAAAVASKIPFSTETSGVVVFSRAKNAGASDLNSTCAGSPSESHISARAVAAVSAAVNAPCSNSIRTIGSLSTSSPSVAGSASPAASSSARDFACAIAFAILAMHGARQFRHQHRAHGDADEAQRQFDQAAGEIKPRHRRRRGGGDDRRRRPSGAAGRCSRSCRERPWQRIRASRGRRKRVSMPRHRRRAASGSTIATARRCRRSRPAPSRHSAASCRHSSSAIVTAISATLNSSGENAVSAKRPRAFISAISTVTGPGEGEIRQHQPGIAHRKLQRLVCRQSRARALTMTSGISTPISNVADHQRHADGAEQPPGKRRRRGRALGLADPQIGRHQRRIQRALGEQPPHHIDELERDQKRVRHRAGAEQRRDQRIPGKAEQPRGQRARGHREEGADHGHVITAPLAGAWAERDRPQHLFNADFAKSWI